ncbi:MAG: 3,4-dihydroxy-2-butanone 4-phosphate synthase, partial [Nitrososphaeraceae archaeon]|nr:3,4-dihydroxy-2-butanone 4-phosphate synthase [Nitrososphaeraceae archaeon]
RGSFVLIHDDTRRENEVDMVIAAEHIKPRDIAIMRNRAGGLICLAISHKITEKLGLMYMRDILRSSARPNTILSKIVVDKTPYGDRPSFSLSINHIDTFTGITDVDRALTISKMADVCRKIDSGGIEEFANSFRAPGHVPLLIASNNLLEERTGHTELSIYLMQIARLVPAVVICEMLDSTTHRSLSINKAKNYANKFGIVLIESNQLIRSYSRVAN